MKSTWIAAACLLAALGGSTFYSGVSRALATAPFFNHSSELSGSLVRMALGACLIAASMILAAFRVRAWRRRIRVVIPEIVPYESFRRAS